MLKNKPATKNRNNKRLWKTSFAAVVILQIGFNNLKALNNTRDFAWSSFIRSDYETQNSSSLNTSESIKQFSDTTKPETNINISGVVYDEKGEPLVGATIKIENSYKSVITDLNGRFELSEISTQSQLKISYIGYIDKTVETNSTNISVQLEPNTLTSSEIVVTGFRDQKSENNSANCSHCSTIKAFGKREFIAYFNKTNVIDICNNKPAKLKASFKINLLGRPTNLKITNCNCPELKSEFVRVLNRAPNWSGKNKKIELRLKIN